MSTLKDSEHSGMDTFIETKKLFKQTIQHRLAGRVAQYAEKEAALPAYAHRNPLIDMLFWGRLRSAYMHSGLSSKGTHPMRVLDYGCGTGVFSYYLARTGHTVVGADIELGPLQAIHNDVVFPETCTFMHVDALENEPANSFDYIFALDVLEHVTDLEKTIVLFQRLIKKGGIVIVSAPTENVLYRIGRRIAGKEFSGEYHHTTSAHILEAFRAHGDIIDIQTLYPFAPFFQVFTCRLR